MTYVVKVLKGTEYHNILVSASTPNQCFKDSKVASATHAIVIAYYNGKHYKSLKEPVSRGIAPIDP